MNKIKEVYTIIENGNDKNTWVRVGSAFVNRDGSITVSLNALPTNGRLHIRDSHKPNEVSS